MALCECGCGRRTRLARQTERRSGWVKGQPLRYLKGHSGATSLRRPFVERFWSKVRKTRGCWYWLNSNIRGYGRTSRDGRPLLAPRASYELRYGAVPRGLLVLHSCDVPACVRPSHLFVGTNADNIADSMAKGRRPSGERMWNAKRTWKEISEIRRRYEGGERQRSLALAFNTCQQAISDIVRGKTWRKRRKTG
mgnify:CR=1 FL=1